jgi:hypothetical protein
MPSSPEAPSLVAGVGSTPVAWGEVRPAEKLGHAILDELAFDTSGAARIRGCARENPPPDRNPLARTGIGPMPATG